MKGRNKSRICGNSDICFFFNDTATTEIYTLSLHDALPIWEVLGGVQILLATPTVSTEARARFLDCMRSSPCTATIRSEEHTSELQSRQYLACRLLLEKMNLQSFTINA